MWIRESAYSGAHGFALPGPALEGPALEGPAFKEKDVEDGRERDGPARLLAAELRPRPVGAAALAAGAGRELARGSGPPNLPAPSDRQGEYADVDGARIFHEVAGQGEPIPVWAGDELNVGAGSPRWAGAGTERPHPTQGDGA